MPPSRLSSKPRRPRSGAGMANLADAIRNRLRARLGQVGWEARRREVGPVARAGDGVAYLRGMPSVKPAARRPAPEANAPRPAIARRPGRPCEGAPTRFPLVLFRPRRGGESPARSVAA